MQDKLSQYLRVGNSIYCNDQIIGMDRIELAVGDLGYPEAVLRFINLEARIPIEEGGQGKKQGEKEGKCRTTE